jgi:protocatechuate 3,4-dioxygenase alpha subunit
MPDLKESPSQTAGPYVHIGCVPSFAGLSKMYGGADPGAVMITGNPVGQRIRLELSVLDGNEEPLGDALIEIWQAGPEGGYGTTEGFSHWGRQPTDTETGKAVFDTLKPGRSVDQAPHILVWIVARGINMGLTTRLYFSDENNSADPTFCLAGSRAPALLARKTEAGYAHVVRLQGPQETVFFDV